MKKLVIIFLIMLFILSQAIAQEGQSYKTDSEGTITSGEVPSDYNGKINGQVALPDGTIFNGEATYNGGKLIVKSGSVGGLSVTNGVYQNGKVSIADGYVDGVSVKNGIGIIKTSAGFAGIAGGDGSTIVEGITIHPAGTKFEYPNPSGMGITVHTPNGGSRLVVDGSTVEIEGGKKAEAGTEGIKTSTAKIVHKGHKGHNHGKIAIDPMGGDSSFLNTQDGHVFLTKGGELLLQGSYRRALDFEGKDNFENSLAIGDNIYGNGGWNLNFADQKYSILGISGLSYNDRQFPGEFQLGLGRILSIEGQNIVMQTRTEGYTLSSSYSIEEIRGQGQINYVSQFSDGFSDTIKENGENQLHLSEMMHNALEGHGISELGENDLSELPLLIEGHGHEHHESPTTSTLNGEEMNSFITHGDGHGQITLFGRGGEEKYFKVFIGEGEHSEESFGIDSANNERNGEGYFNIENLRDALGDTDLRFEVGGKKGELSGSVSYNPFSQVIDASADYKGKLIIYGKIPLGSEVGGHGHEMSFGHDENNYNFEIKKRSCYENFCIVYAVSYDRSRADSGSIIETMHPDSEEHEENHGHN